jgi:hypothetical protein
VYTFGFLISSRRSTHFVALAANAGDHSLVGSPPGQLALAAMPVGCFGGEQLAK